ncbi:hypothetical protein HOY34_03110 [Xinfangfangia sp. D13-10-4-6]|uniref:hypothetical protein n=1 Tax=Pseudogemmobacter hezensis TaxID=2737662 RepID=UPI001556E9D7|nr:hypothetical protein [Pseudogemmobacter hezensis]NPD14186.1 hypothetical protein [Pseudogemmobacter hezensis]
MPVTIRSGAYLSVSIALKLIAAVGNASQYFRGGDMAQTWIMRRAEVTLQRDTDREAMRLVALNEQTRPCSLFGEDLERLQ